MIERYTRPAMGHIWTQENRYQAWLSVELAVCEAWTKLGVIPQKSLENIRAKAAIDTNRIAEIELKTKHDVIAFLTQLEETTGEDSRYIHLGCTSSDIIDTANALLIRQAGKIILNDLDSLLHTLKNSSLLYKGAICMGRTHGIHAEPTSFGLKLAGFYAEFQRHKNRISTALKELEVGKISGAVGTYAFLSPNLEKIALKILNLNPDIHSTQIIQRDRYASFFSSLAIMGGGMERLSIELRHLQRTELLEAEEGFTIGQKGSSAMPHKKNPISAENICGISRLLRANALASMEDQALWHERDISHSSVERVIMPDSTILADYALTRLNNLLENLNVHPDRMQKNMDLSYGLYFSQRVLTALVNKGLPRQKAYELTQGIAMRCWQNSIPFPQAASNDQKLREYLNESELKEIFEPSYYLKYEDEIFNRIFSPNQNEN